METGNGYRTAYYAGVRLNEEGRYLELDHVFLVTRTEEYVKVVNNNFDYWFQSVGTQCTLHFNQDGNEEYRMVGWDNPQFKDPEKVKEWRELSSQAKIRRNEESFVYSKTLKELLSGNDKVSCTLENRVSDYEPLTAKEVDYLIGQARRIAGSGETGRLQVQAIAGIHMRLERALKETAAPRRFSEEAYRIANLYIAIIDSERLIAENTKMLLELVGDSGLDKVKGS